MTFIDAAIGKTWPSLEALREAFCDHIDQWHDGSVDVPLIAYLGLTEVEYKLWVEAVSPDWMLGYIVQNYKDKRAMNNTPDTVLATLAEDRALIQRLKALVEKAQWTADEGTYCPWCFADGDAPPSPHAHDCPAAMEMGWPRSST